MKRWVINRQGGGGTRDFHSENLILSLLYLYTIINSFQAIEMKKSIYLAIYVKLY